MNERRHYAMASDLTDDERDPLFYDTANLRDKVVERSERWQRWSVIFEFQGWVTEEHKRRIIAALNSAAEEANWNPGGVK